jgi:hypothetical protein
MFFLRFPMCALAVTLCLRISFRDLLLQREIYLLIYVPAYLVMPQLTHAPIMHTV